MAHLNYCCHIWRNIFDSNKKYIIQLQNRAIKYISYKNDTQPFSEFMFNKRSWSFDTLVKFNIQYRLKKNTYNPAKFIRDPSRTSRNLFRLTNIDVSHWNYLPIGNIINYSNIINSPNLKAFTRLYKRL